MVLQDYLKRKAIEDAKTAQKRKENLKDVYRRLGKEEKTREMQATRGGPRRKKQRKE